jgi:hypothetical protein
MTKFETNSNSEISKESKMSVFEFVSNFVFRVSNFIPTHACLTTKYGCVFKPELIPSPGYKSGAPERGRISK